jgi:hypothetical protein
MNRLSVIILATMALGGTGAWAQNHDGHHPPAAGSAAPAQSAPPAGQETTGGQHDMMGAMSSMMNMRDGMMGMMRDMSIMGMMGQGMAGMGMAGMGTIDRVDGRIAFLRTELKITDAQASVWSAFAEALRANAKLLGETRAAMMRRTGAQAQAQAQAPLLTDRLDSQEKWLAARLEGTRAMKAAFAGLYGALSDEQKKTANEILAPHLGMGMMARPDQQSGPMGPGMMRRGMMGPH